MVDGRGGQREGAGRPSGNSIRKSFWLNKDVMRKLSVYAEKNGQSVSTVVTHALEDYLNRRVKI